MKWVNVDFVGLASPRRLRRVTRPDFSGRFGLPISTVGEIGARLPSQGRPRKRVHQGTPAPMPASGPAGLPSASALARSVRRPGARQCLAQCRVAASSRGRDSLTP